MQMTMLPKDYQVEQLLSGHLKKINFKTNENTIVGNTVFMVLRPVNYLQLEKLEKDLQFETQEEYPSSKDVMLMDVNI